MPKKLFPLRSLLTVVTERLLTTPEGPRDNGIGQLYEILNWMTNDNLMTHQLPRANTECKPWLLRWFPELADAQAAVADLDRRLKSDKDKGPQILSEWIGELKSGNSLIRDAYEVERIPADDHEVKDPYVELVAMRGGTDGIIVIDESGIHAD